MFFNTKRIAQLEREVIMLEDLFADALKRIAKLEETKHGIKKDGTPKAKPGRKAKNVSVS